MTKNCQNVFYLKISKKHPNIQKKNDSKLFKIIILKLRTITHLTLKS